MLFRLILLFIKVWKSDIFKIFGIYAYLCLNCPITGPETNIRMMFDLIHMCPFDYTAVAVSGKVGP